MTPDLRQEFRLLSEKAKQKLREPSEAEGYRHVFSLWTRPAFSPSSRCSVYAPCKSRRPSAMLKQPFASFSIWRSDLDREKFSSPIERLKYPKDLGPSIQDEVMWLADGDVEQMEQRIRGILIPVFLGDNVTCGTDGTSFEFRYGNLFAGASLQWWVNYPVEWRPFTEPLMQIAVELDERRKKNIGS